MLLDKLFLAFQIILIITNFWTTYKFSLSKLYDELINDKCPINLSFSVHDNISWQIMSEWLIQMTNYKFTIRHLIGYNLS